MKKLNSIVFILVLLFTMIPSMAFAETAKAADTDLSLSEKSAAQVLEEGLAEVEKVKKEIKMMPAGGGREYCRQVYELENGYQLIMEFEDGEEGLKSLLTSGEAPMIRPMATNGETLWKEYGNRYFTAKATAITSVSDAYIYLENHYILSKNGIDENYGVQKNSTNTDKNVVITPMGVTITDASARTVGASDVNMYGKYKIRYSTSTMGMRELTAKLETTVGYVDHNYTTNQIKVKHSWSRSQS